MTNTNQQSMSGLLSQVATVATVKATALGLWRADKQASLESDRAHGAKAGAGKTSASRFAGAEGRIKEITDEQQAGRDCLKGRTTAWGERRLLPNTNIEPFLKEWMPIKARFDAKVQALADDAPRLINEALYNKGSYNVEPPTIDEIRDAYSLEFTMEAIPDASKFQSSNLDKAVEAELKRRFEADIAGAYQQAQKDALKRLAEPLGNFVKRVGEFDHKLDTDGKGARLYESVITNVQDIANVFASFNLTGDPSMDKLTQELDIFRGVDIEALKGSKDLRDATSRKAQAILEGLGDWIR